MKCILGLLALLVVKKASSDADGDPTVTEQLEEDDNRNQDSIEINGGPTVSRLRTLRDTKSCILLDCMWPKAADGKVYIPYVIADHYTSEELDIIKRGINSFSYSTCIRFFPRTNQRDFLYIQSLDGRLGCIYHGTVQHELLHALGFSHEQCRSDRDQHIRVLLQNVRKGQEYNFRKFNTLNQGTPYDYSSVMHYGRLAFSKGNYNPTMVAVPDPSTAFGMARQMSRNDINRINLLYCTN